MGRETWPGSSGNPMTTDERLLSPEHVEAKWALLEDAGLALTADQLRATFAALTERAEANLEWVRDLATVHWVLSEANKDDIPQMVKDVIAQMLREFEDPAISETAAKAQRADAAEVRLAALLHPVQGAPNA